MQQRKKREQNKMAFHLTEKKAISKAEKERSRPPKIEPDRNKK